MPRASIGEIQEIVVSYVSEAKQAGAWSGTTEQITGLLNKIAKSVQFDGLFEDKLPELDGENLPLGKTIEEYYQDLNAVLDYNNYFADPSNAAQDALKPYYPQYESPVYNYSLGKKIIPTTMPYDTFEAASVNAEVAAELANTVIKRLYDSFAVFKYDCKKQGLANLVAKCLAVQSTSGATAYTTNSTVLSRGTRYSQSGLAYICIKSAAAAINKTLATLAAEGEYVVAVNLVSELAVPTDTSTGEAFVESVKSYVEKATDISTEALSGASIGAVPGADGSGLLLIINQGILPNIEVNVQAGAFHLEKIGIPAMVKVIDKWPKKYFDGSTTQTLSSEPYAILIDRRAVRFHPTYLGVRDQMNGAGDYLNYFLHTNNTMVIAKNCFVHVWVKPGA